MKYLLLQDEKLVQVQEEKVQILEAIHASLPAITEKAAILWAAGVPNPDAAIINGAVTGLSVESGTCTEGNSPWSQDLHRGSGTTTLLDHPRLSVPLNLQANCLIADDLDSASKAEVGSDSEGSSEREFNEVCPPPQACRT